MNALGRMREFPLQSLFESTMFSRDGRVIAKSPAMRLGVDFSGSNDIALRAEMVRDYGILVGLVAQAHIFPALEEMLLDRRWRESDMVDLARDSPIVPKGREALFGKALFLGFERDFVSALHLLIPQIEHMVRTHLKQAGATTSNLDRDGIESENGLSTLMNLPEAEAIFGPDLAFEFRSLFCDPYGPNLRNAMAHGMLDEAACHSTFAIYAWWLGVRLVFNTWWNAAHSKDNTESEPQSDVDGNRDAAD